MNLLGLYLLLLKATITSFSGLTSLPVVRNDLVVQRHVLTDRQLNAAVVAGRATPGPNGLYVVSVGYFIAGVPGAFAGWLALVTPAFFIIPLLKYVGARAEQPAIKRSIQSLTIAAAGLIGSATLPLAHDALKSPLSVAIAVASFFFIVFTKRDTLWVIAGSAGIGLVNAIFHDVFRLGA